MKKMKKMKKMLFGFSLVALWAAVAWAEEVTRYEYKILRLGSLSALQGAKPEGKLGEIEGALNREGFQGWEMVSLFAVRTTFDPNVFFVAMKRPLNSPSEKKAAEKKESKEDGHVFHQR
ncbi:MAG: DUF4177 domain-containing protein [Synergistaceae bacterium]|jgi:hypothetical protein|nr:DUF4177 domain-containing protein [Synergistaceae bacterium]